MGCTMTSFDSLLTRVLEDHGMSVSPGPVDGSLLLDTPDDRILLTWHRAEDPDAVPAPPDPRPTADDAPPTSEVDVADEGEPDDGGVEIIDATVPPEGADADEPPAPDAPDPSADAPSADASAPAGSTEPAPEPDPSTATTPSSDASSPEDGAPAPDAGEGRPPAEGEVPVVRLRVDRDEAREEAVEKLLEVHEQTLELVPHLAFEYRCRVPDGTGEIEERTGTVLLNAVTESILTLEAPRFGDGAPEGARLLDPRVDEAEGRERASDHVRDVYTRDVKVEEDDGNVSMVVTKRVTPEDDGVDLELEGTWYLPVWRLGGENGTMRLDAHSGEVLEESLQQVTGTDAEWV